MDKYMQNIIMTSANFKDEKKYWLDNFQGEVDIEGFPVDFERRPDKKFEKLSQRVKLSQCLFNKLIFMSNKSEYGLFLILASGVIYLLHRYTSQNDIVVGMPAFKQNADDINKGNISALRINIDDSCTFKKLLNSVKNVVNEARKYRNIPFEKIAEILNIRTQDGVLPLLNVVVQLENIHITEYVEDINADTVFNFSWDNGGIELNVEYNGSLFGGWTIEQILRHYVNFMEAAVNDPERVLSTTDILSEDDKRRLLIDFNATNADYPKNASFDELFERQVYRTPDKTAVIYSDGHVKKKLTYRELNEKARQLAVLLRKNGVTKEVIVGVIFDRSIEMLTCILAIFKVGGIYLPLDPNFPEERIRYMLEDSGAKLLLGKGSIEYARTGLTTINFDEDTSLGEEIIDIQRTAKVNDIAYVIYTSGSTGLPKGAMLEHSGMINHMYAKINDLKIDENSIIAQNASQCFDISIWQLLCALLTGGCTVIYPNKVVLDPEKFIRLIIEDEITILEVVPSFLGVILSCLELKHRNFEKLRYLVVTGETFKPAFAKMWFQKYPEIKVVNAYGPTEASDDITHYIMDSYYESDRIPIGKPIQNFKIYIVDKDFNLCPVGVKGEILVSGIGVGRGYLNNPERTAEAFIADPFEPTGDTRLYKTGDLGCWMPDGNIQFFGRKDYQVKVRGFRIELGDIEAKLSTYKGIKDSVVIDRENETGEKFLCAYIVSDEEVNIFEIREHLLKSLPEYMMPDYFIKLDKMPLTDNGKVNRKILKAMNLSEAVNSVDEKNYVPPENELERKMVKIWEELLGREKIGVKHSFFELGGHSLKATTLVARMYKEFGLEIPMKEFFKRPTIREIATFIQETDKSAYEPLRHIEDREYYELSSAQRRLFILNQLEVSSTNYNLSWAAEIEGEYDEQSIELAISELVKRHEALRTSFVMIEGIPYQKIAEKVDLKLQYIETDENGVDSALKEFVRPFDLSMAPLLRTGLIKTKEGRKILIFDMHHIIADGVSNEIIKNELFMLYAKMELPELRFQYRDYAFWQNEMARKDKMRKQEEYWLDMFRQEIPVLNMPLDFSRPLVQSSEGDGISFYLKDVTKNSLVKLAEENGTTLFMILLAAYNILLMKYSGQEDITVGSPVAGRTHSDLEGMVGMFVNTVVMRNQPLNDMTFVEFLKKVKENALNAFENQDYPFEELVDMLDLPRDLSRNPLFDTMFVLQNTKSENMIIKRLKDDGDTLSVKGYKINNRTSKFDLVLEAVEIDNRLEFDFGFCTKLFKRQTIQRMAEHYKNIIEIIISQHEIRLGDIDMLSDEEKRKLAVEFNNTGVCYKDLKTIHRLFEEQVEKTPNGIAAEFRNEKITYHNLNKKANSIAITLRKKGLKKEGIVALVAYRSIEMFAAMLGILKAGGAYLPIDPSYPEDRISYMLMDSGAAMVLTNLDKLHEMPLQVLDIRDQSLYKEDCKNLDNINAMGDLAYIIYTSGSTGTPKGVMIEHSALHNFLHSINDSFENGMGAKDRCLSLASISFDVSVCEIFTPLTFGATLVLFDDAGKGMDTMEIANFIMDKEISFAYIPSALLEGVFEILKESKDKVLLDKMFMGAEPIKDHVAEKYIGIGKEMQILNAYGPTECTICATIYKYKTKEAHGRNIPIGWPIHNTKIYIMRGENIVPEGVHGEIMIAGAGLARGYLNNPLLTGQKFVPDPFCEGGRMYRTGDLARRLPDGNIEFLGRIDHQVKIRGCRIEPGEIEKTLLRHEGIKEAVVLPFEDSTDIKNLCAYLVCVEKQTITDLREYLSKSLPEYMIPVYFVMIDKIPLTRNGKIDINVLREFTLTEAVEAGRRNVYEPPRNEFEEQVARIWRELLDLEKISINDNFFEIGGHSLRAITLVSMVNKYYKVNVSLQSIFANPTIKEFANYLSEEFKYISEGSRREDGSVLGKFNDINRKQSVILIREGSTDENIFFIHDGWGEVRGYLEFCKNIDGKYNCWGIRAERTLVNAPENISIEAVATNYCSKIYGIQPTGPYNIAAWSMGGTIAFEMIRQMEEQGLELGRFVLFDAVAVQKDIVGNKEDFNSENEKRLIYYFAENNALIDLLKDMSDIEQIWEAVIKYLEMTGFDEEIFKKIKAAIPEDVVDMLRSLNKTNIRDLVYCCNTMRTFSSSRASYSPPSKIKTQLHYFKAAGSEQIDERLWNLHCEKPMMVYNVEGTHTSIFQKPHVETLSKLFNKVISGNG